MGSGHRTAPRYFDADVLSDEVVYEYTSDLLIIRATQIQLTAAAAAAAGAAAAKAGASAGPCGV
jgi:hypothetical protein